MNKATLAKFDGSNIPPEARARLDAARARRRNVVSTVAPMARAELLQLRIIPPANLQQSFPSPAGNIRQTVEQGVGCFTKHTTWLVEQVWGTPDGTPPPGWTEVHAAAKAAQLTTFHEAPTGAFSAQAAAGDPVLYAANAAEAATLVQALTEVTA